MHPRFIPLSVSLYFRLSSSHWRASHEKMIITGFVAFFALTLLSGVAFAQYGGRASTVETAPAKFEILSNFADVHGRVAAGSVDAITAFTNATIKLAPLKIGDFVKAGQQIAQQDPEKLQARIEILEINLSEAQLQHDEIRADLQGEHTLLAIIKEQATLLASKAARARELASVNALSIEGVETAQNTNLLVSQQVLSRENTIGRKKIQLLQAAAGMARIKADIRQIRKDIASTTLIAPRAGQIVFLSNFRTGYAREGDVIARILDPEDFEVEAEIPVNMLENVGLASQIRGASPAGDDVILAPRVLLPVQNARTGTQTMRFVIKGKLPTTLQADNAVVVLQIPTTSPVPVLTVPKDAVLPVPKGHIVFVYVDGKAVRTPIKLGGAVAESFIVLSGLKEGYDVIVRGNEQLSDGMAVKKSGDRPAEKLANAANISKGQAWTLRWMSPRGYSTGDLVMGKEKASFDGEEVRIVKAGDSVNFIAKKQLPFGIIDLEFNGKIDEETMTGDLIIRGLPGGKDRSMAFSGVRGHNGRVN